MNRTVQWIAAAAAVVLCACGRAAAQSGIAVPAVFYGSQSGRSTLDQGEGGGNPFASALIELLERPLLTYAELQADLLTLTREKSRGFQTPDGPTAPDSSQWRLKPVPTSAKRVALVFVYSNYRAAGVTSLPGAERDLERVTAALRKAGFEVKDHANPSRDDLRKALETLSRRSEDAEAAVIYLTGHGFEHDGQVYLMPNDYPFSAGPNRLPELAVHVPSLSTYLKSASANLVFFGGCRTYW
ncbi:MAG TPA: caspase family protein [Thermoanaerobaculia bacterium]|nr:caspase family protein [Thermoanaerobaculia bacterium]